MTFLRRSILALLFSFVLLLAVLCGLALYFRYFSNLHQQVLSSYAHKVSVHRIHLVSFKQIPTVYRNAVIATEDRRFWWDPGIDPVGIARSFVVDVEQDGYVEGGSTITQQLVDNTIIKHRADLIYKIRQAFYAVGVYASFSKRRIFAMYANVIYFGDGAYGLYSAAEAYFHKPPEELNAGELTMLAGLPNAPSLYDPFTHYSLARQRQSIVLENMVDAGLITRRQEKVIFQEPLHL